ncbi:MAG TPA: hypothetical protein VEK08_26165 [Planctomycetota bacterium]|nr:hypothetical protein [Planctomycetota bacterium]
MTNPKRWFQIRLSTAIILMLLAGVFLGANTITRESRGVIVGPSANAGDRLIHISVQGRGWPLFFEFGTTNDLNNQSVFNFCVNLALALTILAATGIVAEFIARRKDHQAT